MILGRLVTYSINMILFCLSILRLYMLLKVVQYWNIFTNDQSRRIAEFFDKKNMSLFFYKTNLKHYGFYSVIILFSLILYLAALILKVCEHTNIERDVGFSYFWNSLWFLVQTMAASK